MKKSTIEKIEKEINEKTKLPKEVKEKIKKEVFNNFIIGTAIILYFIFIILGSIGSTKNVRTIDLNIFSILFLGIAIFLFEIAYRKDDGKLAIYGLESLVVAVFTLFLPYIIFELNATNKKYYLMVSIYIAIYYILKSVTISLKIKNNYMNSNISDIKEIVKKEKSKRRIKEDIEEVEVKDKNNKKSVGDDASFDPQRKQETVPKKRERAKTEIANNEKKNNVGVGVSERNRRSNNNKTTKDIKKTEIKESVPKKRGRPKKAETTIIENKPKEEPAQKKRGRPRKVVINND